MTPSLRVHGSVLALGCVALLLASPVSPVAPSPGPADGWSQTQKITPQDANEPGPWGNSGAFSYFGETIAADDSTIVATATGSDSAYVFERQAAEWSESANLTEDYDAGFGEAADVDGDLIAIGAPHAGTGGIGEEGHGSVYVFERSDEKWERVDRLTASADPNDNFGAAVAVNGSRIAVGAHGDDTTGNNDGAVFVFERQDGEWTLEQSLMPDRDGAHFGTGLAMEEDTIAVGAQRGLASQEGYGGSAWIYEASSSGWKQTTELVGPSPTDTFGYTLALDEGTVVVGAAYANRVAGEKAKRGENAGAAFVFEGTGGGWTYAQELRNPAPLPWSNFGNAVDVEGSLIVVGARDWPEPAYVGGAHVYREGPSGWKYEASLLGEDSAVGDTFGTGVAVANSNLVVGAPLDDNRRDGTPPPLDDEGDLHPLACKEIWCTGADEGEDAGSVYVFRPTQPLRGR